MSDRVVLEVEGLYAQDSAGPGGSSRGRVQGVRLALPAGVYGFIGTPEDGTLALCEVLTGIVRPSRGTVRVRGHEPYRSSPIRARMGAMLPVPMLPPASTTERSVAQAVAARGEPASAAKEVLASLGLEALARRRLKSLSFGEARAVELALALSTPRAVLVVLHEPFLDVAVDHLATVHERIRALREDGACIVVTTSSAVDARSVAEFIIVMHAGALVRDAPGDGTGLVPASHADLVLTVRSGLRRLAERVSRMNVVASLSWQSADEEDDGAGSLRLRVTDLERGAANVLAAVGMVDAEIDAWSTSAPSLVDVRAETRRLHQARRPARPAPPSPAPPRVAPPVADGRRA